MSSYICLASCTGGYKLIYHNKSNKYTERGSECKLMIVDVNAGFYVNFWKCKITIDWQRPMSSLSLLGPNTYYGTLVIT